MLETQATESNEDDSEQKRFHATTCERVENIPAMAGHLAALYTRGRLEAQGFDHLDYPSQRMAAERNRERRLTGVRG